MLTTSTTERVAELTVERSRSAWCGWESQEPTYETGLTTRKEGLMPFLFFNLYIKYYNIFVVTVEG